MSKIVGGTPKGITSLLKDSGIDGGIIVTTPSEVAILDVQRQIKFCQMVGLPIIGVIENMAAFTCPKCDVTSPIFKPSQNGRVQELCEKNGLKLLGSLPIDPKICKAMDLGILIKYVPEYHQLPRKNVKKSFEKFLTNILSRKGENPMEVESKCIDEMQKITETVKSIL